MNEEINPKAIVDFLKPRLGARFKTWLAICTHCGLCADTCHYYAASGNDPKMIPSYKVRFLNEMLKKKGKVDRAYLQKMYDTIYYECNMCRRCTLYCPFGIDVALLVALERPPRGAADPRVLRAWLASVVRRMVRQFQHWLAV